MLLTGGVFRLLKQSITQTELQKAHTYLKLFSAQAPVLYGKICICEEFVNSYTCTVGLVLIKNANLHCGNMYIMYKSSSIRIWLHTYKAKTRKSDISESRSLKDQGPVVRKPISLIQD